MIELYSYFWNLYHIFLQSLQIQLTIIFFVDLIQVFWSLANITYGAKMPLPGAEFKIC